jgi:predicted O-methyltransferase YrrM
MLSGPLQGKFLEMICRMINPKKVLEIGTFTGYSALSMAKGMSEDGILHTIELREEDAQTALKYFKKGNKEQQIKLHVGNALEIIPNLDENWDLIFIDADKVSYIDYYELTLPKLNRGGWMIVDNVLFHGQVLEDNITGKNAKAIDAFNKHVSADLRVEQLMLTMRDGLTLVRKI